MVDRFYNEDPENEKPFFGGSDDDDDDDDDNDDMYELEQDTIAFIQSPDIIDIMQANIAQEELRHKLLNKAIKIAKDNIFWCFKSAAAKASDIAILYKTFEMVTDDTFVPPPVPEENIENTEEE